MNQHYQIRELLCESTLSNQHYQIRELWCELKVIEFWLLGTFSPRRTTIMNKNNIHFNFVSYFFVGFIGVITNIYA